MSRTIVALSTPNAMGAVALVRLSGEKAIAIADSVFLAKSGRPLFETASRTAIYGEFVDKGTPFDDGIATVFCAPNSYTGENMVEMSCHGNPFLVRKLIDACIEAGASPAGAGEFTRRAFENEKLDLSAAEAVAELIAAESAAAARAAFLRRKGQISEKINQMAEKVSYLAAQLAVWSDYPEEEDAPAVTHEAMLAQMEEIEAEIALLLLGCQAGQMIQEGIRVAIIGSPNVGKSTLLNMLAGEERSIVTEVAGTTRDVVEATTFIDGIALRLMDTAGIRDTVDRVEKIGVDRAIQTLEKADLVLLVLDRSRPLGTEDVRLIERIKNRPHVLALNKTDLPAEPFQQTLEAYVEISAATGEGGAELKAEIKRRLGLEKVPQGGFIASLRQRDCLQRAQLAVGETIQALKDRITLDAAGILLDDAIMPLSELTGRSVSESVLEQIFSNFCVGK